METTAGSYINLWRNSAFRKLWVAQFVSSMGDWLIIGILVPTVTELSGGSSMAVAGLLVAKILPALLLSSLVGAIIDRFPRREIMLVADGVRLLLVLLLLVVNTLWSIYLVVFLMETFSLFFWPARNALIPNIVADADVKKANSFMYTTQQVGMVLGLATSGAIMRGFESLVRATTTVVTQLQFTPLIDLMNRLSPILLGSRAGYFVDSLTFILSGLMILLIHKGTERFTPHTDKPLDAREIGRDAIDSFRFLREHAELRGILISVFIGIVGGGAIVPVGLNYIATLTGTIPFADQFPALAAFAGSQQIFILTWMGVGMASGAILVPRVEKRLPVKLLFPASIATFAIGMVIFALNPWYFLACLLAAGGGFCISMLTVTGNNYVVQHVSDEIRGRVFTTLESVIRISLLISMIITSPVSDFIATVLRVFLADFGITKFLWWDLTGARLTLLLSACVVGVAAWYAFRKVYLADSSWEQNAHTAHMGESDV
ncbi:MAG: MFS transporter [Actinomycetes bacterium]|jgi:dTMP kinase|nr:MFS transporter [Actinomycetes bacterium]